MAIHKTLTASQRYVIYVADRNDDVSHANIAWATMHAIYNEPLESISGANSNSGFMGVF